MWFTDLKAATEKVMEYLGENANYVCIDKVTPCWDGGIVFTLSDFRYVRWKPDGTITEGEKGDWRK